MALMHEQTRQSPREADLFATVATMLRERLPLDWQLVNVESGPTNPENQAMVLLRSPRGDESLIHLVAKQQFATRDVARLEEQFANDGEGQCPSIAMVISRYLAKSTQERLTAAGFSYADATGNLFLRSDNPAVFIRDFGANRDPWRTPGRPRGTLKGEPAAKIVRALLDFPGPWKIRELVNRSKSSTGSVYRVVEFLESEELAARNEDGLITVPDWSMLLRRWSEDYSFLGSNAVTQWIAPRGLDSLVAKIQIGTTSKYAVTGSLAANTWAPYAPTRSAMIYVENPQQLAAEWGLRETAAGVNVLLVRPTYPVVLERTIVREDGLRIAAPTQVAVDLLTGPGRAPAEAEELIDWMMQNERLWR